MGPGTSGFPTLSPTSFCPYSSWIFYSALSYFLMLLIPPPTAGWSRLPLSSLLLLLSVAGIIWSVCGFCGSRGIQRRGTFPTVSSAAVQPWCFNSWESSQCTGALVFSAAQAESEGQCAAAFPRMSESIRTTRSNQQHRPRWFWCHMCMIRERATCYTACINTFFFQLIAFLSISHLALHFVVGPLLIVCPVLSFLPWDV